MYYSVILSEEEEKIRPFEIPHSMERSNFYCNGNTPQVSYKYPKVFIEEGGEAKLEQNHLL